MSKRSLCHTGSGQVMTVLGPIPADQLGITLPHEHILNDCRCWWHPPTTPERQHLALGPVRIEILGELRQDPFVNHNNCALGADPLVEALEDSPFELTYMPAHDCAAKFPLTLEALQTYDAVILSDLGANTLLLHPEVSGCTAGPSPTASS